MKILINEKLCIKCNICATNCAIGIIEKSSYLKFPFISQDNEELCLQCGHCESFCPQKALTMDSFTEITSKISAQDGIIEPQKLSLYLKMRRSIRHYSTEAVARNLIDKLFDAVRYAPTGGNQQQIKWLIIYSSDDVKTIAGLTIDWMRSIQNTSNPLAPYVYRLIEAWDSNIDLICYNAPHLLFSLIPKIEGDNDPTEAIIAMTHFDIAAPSFDIGTCWAGFVKMACDSYRPLQDFLALPEGQVIAGAMIFGYSSFKVVSIPYRNPANIIWK